MHTDARLLQECAVLRRRRRRTRLKPNDEDGRHERITDIQGSRPTPICNQCQRVSIRLDDLKSENYTMQKLNAGHPLARGCATVIDAQAGEGMNNFRTGAINYGASSSAKSLTSGPRSALSRWGALILIATSCRFLALISCQTPNANDLLLQPEARASDLNRLQAIARGQPAAGIDLNQLVSLFNSIQQNQQNQQQRQRAPSNQMQPLALGAMGGQRGGLPLVPGPSSTPAYPFAALANFQPTRRQQQAPQQQQQQQQQQQPQIQLQQGSALFSSSPAPQISLNRLNFGAGPNPRQAVSLAGQNQPRLTSSGNALAAPRQPALVNMRTPLVPPPMSGRGPGPVQSSPNQVRPISGFAPSGPPPSSASNNAISVVQSPSNAIGSYAQASSTTEFAVPRTTTQGAPSSPGPLPTRLPALTTTSTGSNSTAEQGASVTLVSTSESPSATQPASDSSPSTPVKVENTEASNWNPFQELANGNKSAATQQQTTLAPSPDIVTVPPGYDPDRAPPQTYDIPVSTQMGANSAPRAGEGAAPSNPASSSGESVPTPTNLQVSVAATPPMAVTTIIWSPPPSTSEQAPPRPSRTQVQATRVPEQLSSSARPSTSSPPASLAPTVPPSSSAPTSDISSSSSTPPARIRDSSALSASEQAAELGAATNAVVYGKSEANSNKPTGPPLQPAVQEAAGRGFVQSASLDSQVRPFASGTRQAQSGAPFKPSKPLGSSALDGGGAGPGGSVVGSAFSIVANGNQTMPTGDIQDYVAGQPPPILPVGSSAQEATISAHGGPDPFELPVVAAEPASHGGGGSGEAAPVAGSTQPPTRARRPTFKPKPAVPPIRIDSCIVGDDSSCDQSHNERCVTEYGISSCHCRPGFARLSQLRGFCSPVVTLQFSMKIDKLSDDRKLAFNHSLETPNSEEYQYLEFETLQAIASGMQQTSLHKQFMGARVNKFHERKARVWANVSVNLELNNLTKNEQSIQKIMAQELTKLQRNRQALGDSTIVLDAAFRESASATPSPAFSKLQDINECATKELNDCSKHATCSNEFGGFSCQCLAGYEDKYQAQFLQDQSNGNATSSQLDRNKLGRVCMGCSPAYCSNRGECSILEGKKQCKCRANFMGARCDIDSEVLAVAIGGSLVGLVILIVTFWCLFVFNRRWSREQQKMDAMSATSGLTNYNYASNSANSTNGLMSPSATAVAAAAVAQQTARSMGRSSAAVAAANYVGQRFVGGLVGRSGGTHLGHHNHHHHHHNHGHLQHQYALEQQAMLVGSGTSSGSSSAASQPLACNPYQSYAYDEGLLIAPASTGSSEQTSPSGNSYRGIIPTTSNTNHSAAMMAAGSAYTLSGHHHHQHYHHHQQQLYQHLHNSNGNKQQTFSQFHPMDQHTHQQYAARTLANGTAQQNGYDSRWRTLQGQQQQQEASKINGTLAGYYLIR